MSPKFLELETGQHFWFEDRSYIKTSPLKARNESTGHERLMARSAVVTLSEESTPPQVRAPATLLKADDVLSALDRMEQQCSAAVLAVGGSVDERVTAELLQAISTARRECDTILGLTHAPTK